MKTDIFEDAIDCLTKMIIETDFKQKETNQVEYVRMKKIDLLKLQVEFMKMLQKIIEIEE